MVTKIVSFVSFVSFVLFAFLSYQWWASPERAVRNRLRDLAATLSVSGKGGDIGRVARLAQLRRYFADDVHLRWGASGPEIVSRDALMGILSGWTPSPGGWTVEFVDVTVTIGPDQDAADVHLTAQVTGHDARTGEATVDAREATVKIAKLNGEWVMTDAEATETLRRP